MFLHDNHRPSKHATDEGYSLRTERLRQFEEIEGEELCEEIIDTERAEVRLYLRRMDEREREPAA